MSLRRPPELANVVRRVAIIVVLDEDLTAAVARLARHEPDVAAGGARLHVPELPLGCGLAPLQGAPELARLKALV